MDGWETIGVSRSKGTSNASQHIIFDPLKTEGSHPSPLDAEAPYNAVCWAQGRNISDNAYNVDIESHLAVYQANCLYVVATLKTLLVHNLLAPEARLCVISSIWQNLARQDKLSYCMSKAALQGLVLSASVDLAKRGFLINAILPGALDTPMTRQNLAPQQIHNLETATFFEKLPALNDVANLAYFLCSQQNTGITGQFIAADLGFSHARLL